MDMRFNAECARIAVRDYEGFRRAEMESAAEHKVSSIEESIMREAKLGHHFLTVRIECGWLNEKVREILDENGFNTSVIEDGKNIHIEW